MHSFNDFSGVLYARVCILVRKCRVRSYIRQTIRITCWDVEPVEHHSEPGKRFQPIVKFQINGFKIIYESLDRMTPGIGINKVLSRLKCLFSRLLSVKTGVSKLTVASQDHGRIQIISRGGQPPNGFPPILLSAHRW